MCCVVRGRARLPGIRGWAGRLPPRANQVATARSSTTPSSLLQRSTTPPSAVDRFPRRTCTCRTRAETERCRCLNARLAGLRCRLIFLLQVVPAAPGAEELFLLSFISSFSLLFLFVVDCQWKRDFFYIWLWLIHWLMQLFLKRTS